MKKIPYLAPLAKIIPLEYDQSISYYEFLNKLYQYVETELIEKVEEIIEMVNPLLQEFPELKQDVTNLKQFALQTNNRLSQITGDISTMGSNISSIQSHITEIDGSISALNTSIREINNTVSSHTASLQLVQSEITAIQDTITSIQSTISNIQSTLNQLLTRLENYSTVENTVNEIVNGYVYEAEFESVTQDTNVYIDFSNICNYRYLKNHELFIIINQPIGTQDGNAIHTLTIGNTTINLAKFNQLTISNKNIVLKLTLIDDSPEMYIINELEYNTSYTQNYNGANLITRPSDLTTDFAFRYNLVGFTGTATAKVYSKVL